MRFTYQRIRELVASGDDSEIVRLFAMFRKRLKDKSELLKQQADVAANLRHAFMETELDRDRLLRMCGELHKLCVTAGVEEDARTIVDRFGGISGDRESTVIG